MSDSLLTGAATFREAKRKTEWLIIKSEEDGSWELPKRPVRKSESSVQAVLQLMREQAEHDVRVLEEAGKATVSTTRNGKPVSDRIVFYLLKERGSTGKGEFIDTVWLPYSQAKRRLGTEREKRILQQANSTLKDLRKLNNE